jgi:thiamine-monophosphate kinase
MTLTERVTSEETIVQEYLAPLAAGFAGALGLMDDCALLTPEAGTELVLKTDPIIAGVHFFPEDAPEDIAWKALAVNLSDLAAKGARPLAYLMALALPEAPMRDWMAGFARGLAEAQARFACHLVGGDTDRTPGPLTVAITAIGSVPAGHMVRRGTAKPGDRLLVSGELGLAATGLRLRREPALAQCWQLSEREVTDALHKFLRPQPRLSLAPVLLQHASAAMDLSDGLVKDCARMCSASGVGAVIRAGAILRSGATLKASLADPGHWREILAGGDDYEVLAAVPPTEVAALRAAVAQLDYPLTEIGEVTASGTVVVLGPDGGPMPLGSTGWDHFAR